MTTQPSPTARARALPAPELTAVLITVLAMLGCLCATPASATVSRTTAAPWSVVHQGGKVLRHPNPAKYPYATQTNPYAGDPWGSTERQCVGYATWWLNAAGVDFGLLTKGPSGRVGDFGNAKDWAAAARKAGWRVSSVPRVGAVAQWNAGEQSHWTIGNVSWTSWAGSAGHVAIVTAVYPDHTVQVSEYNAYGDRSYHSERTRAPRYLYIGV